MNPKERLIKMMTDEQLRALRSSQIAAQAAALKQASFLNTGTTAAFADIDERAAIMLLSLKAAVAPVFRNDVCLSATTCAAICDERKARSCSSVIIAMILSRTLFIIRW